MSSEIKRDIDVYLGECLSWGLKDEEERRDAFSMSDVQPAIILGSGNGTDEHVKLCRQIISKYPDLDMPYYWLTHHYALKNDFDQARAVLDDGLLASKRKRHLCDEYGWLECEAGRLEEAVKWWIRCAIFQQVSGRLDCYAPFMYLAYIMRRYGDIPLSERLFSVTDSIRSIRLDDIAEQKLFAIVYTANIRLILTAIKSFAKKYISG
ncbi:MAG: hypothetical protein JW869_03590 [Candidatus Omnitrophica bacterium]|nr:hypothetical protein [Candidatus Omnitrophota bacterium]